MIAYYKQTTGDLRFAGFDGKQWNITDLDTTDDSGRYLSMIRKPNGYLATAYADYTTGALRYADQISSRKWALSTIDATTKGVAYISLNFDPNGRPSASYYDAAPGDLKYSVFKSGKWVSNRVATTGTVGLYTKLLFSGDKMANILYYDKTKDVLMLAVGTLGSFSTTQLASKAGRYISADDSPITGQISDSYYVNALGGLKLDVLP
jgi:hypothetical protein